jgi:hypothetical protein
VETVMNIAEVIRVLEEQKETIRADAERKMAQIEAAIQVLRETPTSPASNGHARAKGHHDTVSVSDMVIEAAVAMRVRGSQVIASHADLRTVALELNPDPGRQARIKRGIYSAVNYLLKKEKLRRFAGGWAPDPQYEKLFLDQVERTGVAGRLIGRPAVAG